MTQQNSNLASQFSNTQTLLNENPHAQVNSNHLAQFDKNLIQKSQKPTLEIGNISVAGNALTARNPNSVTDQQLNNFSYSMRNKSSLGYLFNQKDSNNSTQLKPSLSLNTKSFGELPPPDEFNLTNQNKNKETANFQLLRQQWQESVNSGKRYRSISRENYQ